MKIYKRIKRGKLKGYTIRKSKHSWYNLYNQYGISQTTGKHTLKEIKEYIKDVEGKKQKVENKLVTNEFKENTLSIVQTLLNEEHVSTFCHKKFGLRERPGKIIPAITEKEPSGEEVFILVIKKGRVLDGEDGKLIGELANQILPV